MEGSTVRTARDERKAGSRRATSQPKRQADPNGAVDPRTLKELVEALDAARRGDFSVRLSKRRKGVMGEVAASYNELVATNQRMTKELVRIARVIGREGRMTERATLPGATGGWEASIDSINSLIDDLVRPDHRGRPRAERRWPRATCPRRWP